MIPQAKALHPAERLLWSLGLSEDAQIRRAEILTSYVPPEAVDRLIRIADDAARERQCQALERAYGPAWESTQRERENVERFHRHYAEHVHCAGRFSCREWNPPDVATDAPEGTCVICGGPNRTRYPMCTKCYRKSNR